MSYISSRIPVEFNIIDKSHQFAGKFSVEVVVCGFNDFGSLKTFDDLSELRGSPPPEAAQFLLEDRRFENLRNLDYPDRLRVSHP